MKQLTVTGSKVLKPGISQIGLGTMRMPGNREAGIKAIHTVLDAGITYRASSRLSQGSKPRATTCLL